jgi:hypothetical protein
MDRHVGNPDSTYSSELIAYCTAHSKVDITYFAQYSGIGTPRMATASNNIGAELYN